MYSQAISSDFHFQFFLPPVGSTLETTTDQYSRDNMVQQVRTLLKDQKARIPYSGSDTQYGCSWAVVTCLAQLCIHRLKETHLYFLIGLSEA